MPVLATIAFVIFEAVILVLVVIAFRALNRDRRR